MISFDILVFKFASHRLIKYLEPRTQKRDAMVAGSRTHCIPSITSHSYENLIRIKVYVDLVYLKQYLYHILILDRIIAYDNIQKFYSCYPVNNFQMNMNSNRNDIQARSISFKKICSILRRSILLQAFNKSCSFVTYQQANESDQFFMGQKV